MFKKIWLCSIMGLLIALWCCPLGAEQKPNAGNNTTQFNYWTQVSGSAQGGVKWGIQADQSQKVNEGTAVASSIPISLSTPSGPQDLCNFTAVCLDAAFQSCDNFGFPGGELCQFQDPAKACPPPHCPTYPFEVKAVHVRLSNCDPVNSCMVIVTPGIRAATYPTNPNCPVPGNMICTGPAVQIIIPPNTLCQEYIIPLDPNCCVDTSYFACVNLQFPTHCQGFSLCHDMTCDPCCSYWDQTTGNFVEVCPTFLTGNLYIWTDGAMSCQNNCVPPPPDTGANHFKTWRIQFLPTTAIPPQLVKDQFMKDTLRFVGLDYLSNPTQKKDQNGTFNITDTTEHLNWYRVFGRNFTRKVAYKNQFESLSVTIDSVKYFLVPAQKLPHNPPDSLDHYKAYRIKNPQLISKAVILDDQFDQLPEQITTLLPVYFLTPAEKIRIPAEPRFDTLTHYVAYLINPQTGYSGTVRTTIDQFGQYNMLPLNSELLLVPTKKICNAVPGDVNGSGGVPSLPDVIYLVNYVFDKDRPPCLGTDPGTCWPIDPLCRGDVNGSGGNPNLQDVIHLVNFVFDKDRIATGCLGVSPGNCWCPEPTETCCNPVAGCP